MNENAPDLQPLSDEEIEVKLKDLPGWEYKDNKISKQFEFASFGDGIKLIDKLTPFCNEIDHHPDICINYKKIKFVLTRYSIGGKVTSRDFTIAQKIEEIYRQMYPQK